MIALEREDLPPAGRMVERLFIFELKRRRVALELTQTELADRVSALGGSLYQQTIAKLESGQRALRLSEAGVIAQALDTTVSEMLDEANRRAWAPEAGLPRDFLENKVDELTRRADDAERRVQATQDMLHAARAEMHHREADHAAAVNGHHTVMTELAFLRGQLEEARRAQE